MKTQKMGIIGCGDFLRCELDAIRNSTKIEIHSLFDSERDRADKYAQQLGGSVRSASREILEDPEIDLVALFVPPWARKDLLLEATKKGKHIIATKPLAPTVEDCLSIGKAVEQNNVRAAVIYGRTESACIETAKDLFEEGRYGKLALYKQDWLHAYPKWNQWATDPDKNGGPFMDAMIHNLNAACYLMDAPVQNSTFFSSRLAHPDLACADTESMVLEFGNGAMANLFITWAADLATYETEGNFREHIDLFYMITDQGWRITQETRDGMACLVASREGHEEVVTCTPLSVTPYDAMADYIETGQPHRILAGIEEATRDIRLIRKPNRDFIAHAQ